MLPKYYEVRGWNADGTLKPETRQAAEDSEAMHHVILGAGPAGVIAAETIRKHKPGDEITIVGDEPEPPYSRMAIPYLLMGNIDESGT